MSEKLYWQFWSLPLESAPTFSTALHPHPKTTDFRRGWNKKNQNTSSWPSVHNHRCRTLLNYCKLTFLHSSLSNSALSMDSFVFDCVNFELLWCTSPGKIKPTKYNLAEKHECLVKEKNNILIKYALLFSDVANFCNTLIAHIPFMHHECQHAFKTQPAGLKHQKNTLLRLAPSHTQFHLSHLPAKNKTCESYIIN